MLRKLTAVLLTLSLLFSLSIAFADDLLDNVKAAGKIVIATEGDWAPWTYHDETDAFVGFDVDVARAVAAYLGVEASFIDCPWESIFMGIDSKMYDITANGVEINSFEDLKGKRTVNSAGSTYALTAEGYGATADIVSTLAQTMDLVLIGSADATLNAELSFYDYVKEHPEANLKIAVLSEEVSPVAIPIRKGAENATFLAAVNEAIEALRADGTLKAISEKYFGGDITTLE